jgi:hypothetical protein
VITHRSPRLEINRSIAVAPSLDAKSTAGAIIEDEQQQEGERSEVVEKAMLPDTMRHLSGSID